MLAGYLLVLVFSVTQHRNYRQLSLKAQQQSDNLAAFIRFKIGRHADLPKQLAQSDFVLPLRERLPSKAESLNHYFFQRSGPLLNNGELVFGKNDTKFKKSEGKIDLFNETVADIAQITPGQDRLENVIGYQSAQIEGFAFSATYQTAVSDETAGGYDWVLGYGDQALKKYPLYLAYGRTNELNNISAERYWLSCRCGNLMEQYLLQALCISTANSWCATQKVMPGWLS